MQQSLKKHKHPLSLVPKVQEITPAERAERFKIIVVGREPRSVEVCKELRKLGLKVKKWSLVRDLTSKSDGDELAIIYVSPLSKGDLLSVHRKLYSLAKFRSTPFFAVVPEWLDDASEREMYASGIRMIFEWPKEKPSFSQLVAGVLATGSRPVRSKDSDIALENAVRNRLRAKYGSFIPDVRAVVYNGIVMLRGQIRSIWRKNNLIDDLRTMPGVQGVVAASVEVTAPRVSAADLKRLANQLIYKVNPELNETIDVDVDGQKLILTGSCESAAQLEVLRSQLSRLEGIAEVESRVKISIREHRRDKTIARQVQRLVQTMPLERNDEVTVKVQEGKAVLRGFAANKLEAQQIENSVSAVPGVRGVINEIRIMGTG